MPIKLYSRLRRYLHQLDTVDERCLAMQMAAAQAQQRAAAAQQQQQMGRNPFSGFGGGSPFGFQQQRRRSGPAAAKPGPDFAQQGGGPVIDAEFETIDDGDK